MDEADEIGEYQTFQNREGKGNTVTRDIVKTELGRELGAQVAGELRNRKVMSLMK